ncbi:MAG: DUF393 domain-containing protein [SAR324 cluster bacterium]|nr:DUF393 domain-containing protein [SAR324 cluster bacterium]
MSELTVYYDGACHLCSREIAHYQKKDKLQLIEFMDISAASFEATSEGLNSAEVKKMLHVRLVNGELRTGVDAFIAIWQTLPGYVWMADIAKQSGVKWLLSIAYHGFAKIRPLLPKRKVDQCDTGYCSR